MVRWLVSWMEAVVACRDIIQAFVWRDEGRPLKVPAGDSNRTRSEYRRRALPPDHPHQWYRLLLIAEAQTLLILKIKT
jgi:hypothetical protein